MNTYTIVIDVDGGAAFHHTRVEVESANDCETAERNALARLREEYKNTVAFFNVDKICINR